MYNFYLPEIKVYGTVSIVVFIRKDGEVGEAAWPSGLGRWI